MPPRAEAWIRNFGFDEDRSIYRRACDARDEAVASVSSTASTSSASTCAEPELARIERQIAVDLPRIFISPQISSEARRESLGRVLRAWAHANPAVSYVQGMHAIAGASLLPHCAEADPPNVRDEERAYCMLNAVVSQVIPDFFSPGMPGLLLELAVLEQLVAERRPSLTVRMAQLGVMMTLLPTTSWFLTLFQQEGALAQ